MAIAFDAATGVTTNTNTSTTVALTVGSGASRVLFVGVLSISGATAPSSVTYAGAAMTLIKSGTFIGSDTQFLYALLAPASGANNIVVTFAASTAMYVLGASYSGMNQSLIPDNSLVITNTPGTSLAPTLTTAANNSWAIALIVATGSNLIAGSGTTLRTGTGQQVGFLDGNGPVTPPGSVTLNASYSSGNGACSMVSWAPASLISFDNAITSSLSVSVTSKTQAFTVGSGANRLLFVAVKNFAGSPAPSGVTYAGSSMTLVKNVAFSSGSRSLYLYALSAPSSGSNNIVVSFASAASMYIEASSYAGSQQSVVMDASATSTGSGTSASPSLTTIADNCWTLGFFDVDGGTSISSGAGTVIRASVPTNAPPAMADSNSSITPPGVTHLNATFTSGGWGTLLVSFAPAGGSPPAANGNFFIFF